MIEERRTESGTGEAVGRWGLDLRPDTPKTILDLFDFANAKARFATLVITPTRVDAGAVSTAVLRSSACYVGILRSRSSELSIGGTGVASLLGNEDGSCEVPTAAVAFTAATLATALDSYLASNGITKGAVTNTGTSITATLAGYVSRRATIQRIVDACGGEWRITTDTGGDLDLDAATNTALFGSTPPALVIETSGGREPGIIGLEAVEIDQAHDIDDFATKQYVLARADGGVSVGSASSGAAASYFNGVAVKMEAVTDSTGTDAANANTVATLLLGGRQTLKRNISVSVRAEDLVGRTWGPSGASTTSVRCGDSIYIYDPLHGLVDAGNVQTYRGQQVFPIKTRIYGITWPVLGGMGVYLLSAESTPVVTDLSDWYVAEAGAAMLDVGAQVRSAFLPVAQGPESPYGDLPAAVAADAWRPYTPTLTNVTVGNGSLTAYWRRLGRDIEFYMEFVLGSTSAITGNIRVSLPVAAARQIPYLMRGGCFGGSGSWRYLCHPWTYDTSNIGLDVLSTTGTYATHVGTSSTIPFTWATSHSFSLAGSYEAAAAA